MRTDYLIIGGGVAGVTAAETIRQRDASGGIRVLGDEPHQLYSRVLLPHVVRGKVPEEKAFLRAPGALAGKDITYEAGMTVARVDAGRQVAVLANGEELEYGKLLIATGGSVRQLDCPGAAEAGCLSFQTLDDARQLIAAKNTAKALVYGGGFIGLELAMSFAHHGASVTAVVRGDGFFSRVLDARSKQMIHSALTAKGVEVLTHSEIRGIETSGGLKKVFLKGAGAAGRETITCTAVATGIGITPNVGFLEGSGIAVNAGILTDEQLRASVPNVFAAGDVAEFMDLSLGSRHIVGNWQNAMFQGRTAGANMTGDAAAYDAVTSYSIGIFDLPAAFMGAVDVPVDERISREGSKGGALQLFVKGGRVVGATSVGPFADRAAVTRLLAGKEPLSASHLVALRDSRAPLDAA